MDISTKPKRNEYTGHSKANHELLQSPIEPETVSQSLRKWKLGLSASSEADFTFAKSFSCIQFEISSVSKGMLLCSHKKKGVWII